MVDLRSVALASALASMAGPALAEPAPRPSVVKTVRFTLPFTDHTVVNGDRTDSTGLGLALGLLLSGTWSAEVNVAIRAGHPGVFSRGARFGVWPTLLDQGDEDGGWTLNLGPFLGYRYETRRENDDGYEPEEHVHLATGALRVAATRWWPSERGLEIAFAVGLALPLARSENDTWGQRKSDDVDYRHGVDIGGSVGFSF